MPVEETTDPTQVAPAKRKFPPPPRKDQEKGRRRLALKFDAASSREFAASTQREIRSILAQTRSPWGEPAKLSADAVKKLEGTLLDLQADLSAREDLLRFKEARVVERDRELAETAALIDARMRVLESRTSTLETREHLLAEREAEADAGAADSASTEEMTAEIARLRARAENAERAADELRKRAAGTEEALAETRERAEGAEAALADLRERSRQSAVNDAETEQLEHARAETTTELRERDEVIARLKQEKGNFERRMREQDNEIARLNRELETSSTRPPEDAEPAASPPPPASAAGGSLEQEALKAYLEELEQRDRSLRDLRDELKERQAFIDDCEDKLLERSMELSVREAALEQNEEDGQSDRRRILNETGSLEDELDEPDARAG